MAGIGGGCTFLYSEGITQYAFSSVTLSGSLIRTPASIAYSSDTCFTQASHAIAMRSNYFPRTFGEDPWNKGLLDQTL